MCLCASNCACIAWKGRTQSDLLTHSLTQWVGSVTIWYYTYNQEVAGSTPGWIAIKRLLLGRVTFCGKVNHFGI